MAETAEKVRENRVRRWAKRLHLSLRRSRVQLVTVDDHGGYRLLDADTGKVIAGEDWELDLDDVEKRLAEVEQKIVARRAAPTSRT